MRKRKIKKIIPLLVLSVIVLSGILIYRSIFSAVKVTGKSIDIRKFNATEDISWYRDIRSNNVVDAVYGPAADGPLMSEDPLDYVAFDVCCFFKNESPVSDYWLNGYLDVGSEYSDRFLFCTNLSMGVSDTHVFRGDEHSFGNSCLVFCRKGLADEELEKIAKDLNLHITGNGDPIGNVEMNVSFDDCNNIIISDPVE